MEIIAAFIAVLGLLAVEIWRRRGDERRLVDAAAAERGQAYEAFTGDALNALSALQRLVTLAPRIGLLPPAARVWKAAGDAQEAQAEVARSHARVRRLAPDDLAIAADALLEGLRHGSALVSARERHAGAWDKVWVETRAARVEFERLARIDTAARSDAGERRRHRAPMARGLRQRSIPWKRRGSPALLTAHDVKSQASRRTSGNRGG